MPLYEYKCSKCDKIFEVRQKFSDPPVTMHEECGGTVERMLSAPAFQLKGSGWYATDYAKSGSQKSDAGSNGSNENKSSEHKSEGAKTGESKGGESKSDSKSTDSKSESKSTGSESKSESKPAAPTKKD